MLKEKLKKYWVCEADDLGHLLPGLDTLTKIKEMYPKFKFTAFTVPMPKQILIKENVKHFSEEGYKKWAKVINSFDWLEIAVHGLFHTKKEFTKDYDYTMTQIDAIENTFKRIGLNYKKIFKAPYWQYSWWALKALRDRGYIIALDRNHPLKVPEGCKTYYYNWSFEEPAPQEDIIKGHGHMYGGQIENDLDRCFANISGTIPTNSDFLTISEYLTHEDTCSNATKNG